MKTRTTLRFAVTPCPNDTYTVGAIATGALGLAGADIALELHDIEHLNQAALAGRYDVVKISCAIYGRIAGEYAILDTGAALTDGFGPMVLARTPITRDRLREAAVVVPGANTTAALLFTQWADRRLPLAHARYDEIIAGVAGGIYDAGVIIHESRFTFQDLGLTAIADLGQWWCRETAGPLALGCYVIRRALAEQYAAPLEQLLRRALDRAEAGDPAIDHYIRSHAQELDEDVTRRHIELYVNDYTRSLGTAGRAAIDALTFAAGAGHACERV